MKQLTEDQLVELMMQAAVNVPFSADPSAFNAEFDRLCREAILELNQ